MTNHSISAKELGPDEPAPPPVDHAAFVRMSDEYVVLVEKLLGSTDLERKALRTNPLAENARRFLAVSRDMRRGIPDFKTQQRAEILKRAPEVAHALLRFATDVHFLSPIIDTMLEQPTAQEFIRSRLNKLNMIEDVISELSYFGWLQFKGLAIDFKQLPGQPEGIVKFEAQDLWVEVKTIHDLEVNVRKRIEQANKQVKRAGVQPNGICVIRHPTSLDPYQREEALAKVDDGIQRGMQSRLYRSIAAVVLQWDEVLVEEHQEDVWLFTSRGSRLYYNPYATHPLSGNLQDLCPAATAVARIVLRPS